jgi:hypothetical protein
LCFQLVEYQILATKFLQSWPLQPALKGALLDVTYHSKIDTQHTMMEVMNHIKVLLKTTVRSEYFLSENDESQEKSTAGFKLQIDLTKHQQRLGMGLRPGNITHIIIIEATTISLILPNQSMDCLQAN